MLHCTGNIMYTDDELCHLFKVKVPLEKDENFL